MHSEGHSKVLRYLVLATVVGLAGCGRLSFIGERMNNFAAYYNTFYNAEKALEEGVRSMEEQTRSAAVDQDVFVSLFGSGASTTTRREPFENAVEKCADLLRDHPDSKWVDDAMMIIGKAWYYTRNFVGATQKFEEVLTLESPLHDEARFWLARTHIAGGEYSLAYDLLQATLTREEIDRRWEPLLRLALADLHVEREEWELAAQELESGLEQAGDRDLAGRGWFLLGQVYEALERAADAVDAYNRVNDHRPAYELSYAAQYSVVRLQADQGDPEEAMLALRRMERDDKHFDHRAELTHLRGRTLLALGYYDEALETFYMLLYDENVRAGIVRGPTHYALGVFYRDIEIDYPYAAAHFDSAGRGNRSTAVTQSTGSPPRYAPGAITDSEELAHVFADYVEVLDKIVLLDSLLYLGSLDDSTFQQKVLELRERLRDELEEEARLLEQQQAESQFRGRDTGGFGNGFGGGNPADQGGTGEAGFLFHKDIARMQQARADFLLHWGDRPLAPNWRRLKAIEAVATEDADLTAAPSRWQTIDTRADLPVVDVSDVPRDSLTRSGVHAERALARYEMGNVLFLSMSLPDSAASWYRMVIEEDGDEPIAQRALYALAEVQLFLGDTLAAHTLYRDVLTDTTDSELAMQAAARLGLSTEGFAVQDSLTLAESAYADASSLWEDGQYGPAFDGMVALAVDYSTTPVAPRALFAAGQTYLEWAKHDSLNMFAPLPTFSWPSGVVPDSTAPDSVDLTMLYQRLPHLYPGAREAEQALSVAAALEEHWQALYAPVDSVMTDSLIVDSLATSDSTAVDSLHTMGAGADSLNVQTDAMVEGDATAVVMPDSVGLANREWAELLAAAVDIRADDPSPTAQDSVTVRTDASLGRIDWSRGGYTLVVGTEERRDVAIGFADNFGRSLDADSHPMDIFAATEQGRQVFRIGFGIFETLGEAEAVLEEFAAYLPAETRAVRLPKR